MCSLFGSSFESKPLRMQAYKVEVIPNTRACVRRHFCHDKIKAFAFFLEAALEQVKILNNKNFNFLEKKWQIKQ
jgi:hypothetical protein